MKTPKEYTNLIKKNQITKDIIGQVLYSINKRAKNWRDTKREYKSYRYDRYGNVEKAEEQEQKYYKMKSDILNLFDPILIHKELKEITYKVYDYEFEYDSVEADKIIRQGKYFDYEEDQEVYFYVVSGTKELYYLYYEIGEFSFHEPIEEYLVEKYNLEVKLLQDFETFGKDINDLLSTQFCKKVYDKLINNELEIIN